MSSDPQRVVIVGAGPAGLTAAAELVRPDRAVTVLERDPEYVGGISRTVRYKNYRFDIGGHRFFSKNAEITRWWKSRLPEDFLTVKRRSRIYYGGKYYDYPLRPANALRNLGMLTSAACLASYAASQLFPVSPERSFADWVSNRFGRRLFNIFFKTYTEKVWGMACETISADWAAQRIKGLSLLDAVLQALRGNRQGGAVIKTLVDEFQYPRLGPGMMWEKTRDDLLAAGVGICMGRRVETIRHDGRRVTSVLTRGIDGAVQEWPGHQFILSMPLREAVLAMDPGLGPEARAAATGLKYRDFITVALMIRGSALFPDNWIYIHDPAVRVGRVQNFNNWSPEMVAEAGITCLGLEYFCSEGDDLWSLGENALIHLAKTEIARIGLAVVDRVIDACVVKVEKAYPVYDEFYQNNVAVIRRHLAKLENLQPVGRNGMHKYNNQDHSMMTALLAARNLAGARFDLWKVNTDAEYHEETVREGAGSGRLTPERISEEASLIKTCSPRA